MRTLRVHVRDPFEVYCGRLSHVPFGFKGLGKDGCFGNYAPGGTVEAFKPWFQHKVDTDLAYRHEVEALKGKRLGCFCAAEKECHVDTIVAWLDRHEGVDAQGKKLTGAAYVLDLARRIQTGKP